MAKSNRKSSDDDPKKGGTPAWMVTYGDMMTLLLTFFVVIVSFSTIEMEKFRAAIGAFRGALQIWSPSDKGPELIKKPQIKYTKDQAYEAAEQILDIIDEEGLSNLVEVYEVGGGVRIIFSDLVLFDEGRDELKPLVIPILNKVVKIALESDATEVMIEGHTDDTPIHTKRFPSNWELSTSRALKVLKYFQMKGFQPQKLVAVGYGEYRPRELLPPNATREEKTVNRRVEVFLNMKEESGGLFSKVQSYRQDHRWGD